MTTLADLVDIVRQSRERTAGVFPLPDTWDCVDYAITEIGETIDTQLRMKRNGDKRNHDKQATPEHERMELGQVGYMLASALMQESCGEWGCGRDVLGRINRPYGLRLVLKELSLAAHWHEIYGVGDALLQWGVTVERHYDYNPADLLRETCAAFEAKHLPVVRGYDFEPVGKLFRYPVLSAEDAAKQGEQVE